jgi:hypothetical protein
MSKTRKEIETWLNMSNDEMRLKCGELTTNEIRAVKAVLKSIYCALNDDTSKPETELKQEDGEACSELTISRFVVHEYAETWHIASDVSGITIQRKVCDQVQARRIAEILNDKPAKEKSSCPSEEETWRADAGWKRADEAEEKLKELYEAVRNLRDVSGRYHTQKATEQLFSLLQKNLTGAEPHSA